MSNVSGLDADVFFSDPEEKLTDTKEIIYIINSWENLAAADVRTALKPTFGVSATTVSRCVTDLLNTLR